MAGKKIEYRTEIDRFGEIAVPQSVYWGAQTSRAIQDGIKVSPLNWRFLESLLLLYKAVAHANAEAALLDAATGRTIGQAVDEVMSGQWHDQFVVPPFQASAVAAVTANVREVLANRSGEILGTPLGSYATVHPDLQVGLGRNSSDDFALGLRVALLLQQRDLESPLRDLERLLRRKALDFERGQDFDSARTFNAFGAEVGKICKRISDLSSNLLELPLLKKNSTEYGADLRIKQLVADKLSAFTGLSLRLSDDGKRLHSVSDFVEFSSGLRLLAITLNKIAQEKLDSSKQGIAEFMMVVSYQIIGLDASVAALAQSGQLPIDGFLALSAHNLLLSCELLKQTVVIFNRECLSGINSNSKLSSNDRNQDLAASI